MQIIDAAALGDHQTTARLRVSNRSQWLIHVCLTQALPPFLQAVVDRLVAAGVYSAAEAPNHCLVNEYKDGAGIPPHDDGPLYLNKVGHGAIPLCLPFPRAFEVREGSLPLFPNASVREA